MEPTPAAPRVHLEPLQTAVPTRAVEPGRTRRIAVAAPPLPAAALQRRTRVVLYYRADDGASARLWEEAMWTKESLSQAIADHPEMAGRLRRHADGSREVKLNDAGVRFAEATADATIDEFLAAVQGKEQQARSWETALAPWVDVNAEDPDVSALLYVQLTRFQGDGGFAVGVSCSLMLSDPLSLAKFLASWARTHDRIKAQNDVATHPLMQYASYFRHPGARAMRALIKSVPLDAFASADGDHAAETVLFRARPTTTSAATDAPDHHALAVACVAQASERRGEAGKVVPPQLPAVIFNRDNGDGGLSVETCAAAANGQPWSGGGGRYKLEAAQWQELGLEELVLRGSKPLHASYSILNNSCDGLAVVMPDDGAAGEFLVAATVPK